jgi:hypothetical protein
MLRSGFLVFSLEKSYEIINYCYFEGLNIRD